MTVDGVALILPPGLSSRQRHLLDDLAHRNEVRHGNGLLGLVLSGSAGRGMATERSDLDVYVVLEADAAEGQPRTHSSAVDELPVTISDLEVAPPFGSRGWWQRWSFAWAPTLFDRTGGRLQAALTRQATLTTDETYALLIEHDRLDGWINYAYRALKNDRDGRQLERRLDAAESVPWLLDVIYSLAGRVRPYHKYLPWELRHHPLPGWPAEELLMLLPATLDGDPSAIRAAFARVEALCAAFDRDNRTTALTVIFAAWGDELNLFQH